MKIPTIFLCIMLLANIAHSQYIPENSIFFKDLEWTTVWVDSLNPGDTTCQHEWIYSETWRAGRIGALRPEDSNDDACCVYHTDGHCPWDDSMRGRICKKCMRHEVQRGYWNIIPVIYNPETEYEILQKQLKGE